jgi:hypothetical protein
MESSKPDADEEYRARLSKNQRAYRFRRRLTKRLLGIAGIVFCVPLIITLAWVITRTFAGTHVPANITNYTFAIVAALASIMFSWARVTPDKGDAMTAFNLGKGLVVVALLSLIGSGLRYGIDIVRSSNLPHFIYVWIQVGYVIIFSVIVVLFFLIVFALIELMISETMPDKEV